MAMAMVAGMAHGHAMAMDAGMAHGPGQRVAPFWRPENGQGFAGQRVNRNCCGSPFAPRNCAHFPGTKKGPFFEKKIAPIFRAPKMSHFENGFRDHGTIRTAPPSIRHSSP